MISLIGNIKNVGIAGHTGKRSGKKWVKMGTKIPSAANENQRFYPISTTR
jgi:hypothetical protein